MIARVLYLAFIILLLFSCEESVDGCLDIRSSNFDVTAVTACDSCCTFPTGSISIEFVADTLGYNLNDSLFIGPDTLLLNSIQLPFSEFRLLRLGQEFNLIDSVVRYSPGARDDYVVIEREISNTIGHTNYVTFIDSIVARVGLDVEVVNDLKPFIDISGGNNVNQLISKMYNDTIDVWSQARLELNLNDSVRMINIFSIDEPMVSFSDTIDIAQGQNWVINWELDILKLVDGISPDDTDEIMAEKISRNLAKAVGK